jgi:DNA invertase Pin-like site-specific DNA recombinase
MELENIRENTKRGLAAAKANGVKLGKRQGACVKELPTLVEEGLTVQQMAKRLGRSRQAVYSALKRDEDVT